MKKPGMIMVFHLGIVYTIFKVKLIAYVYIPGVTNVRHAYHTWHAEQFLVALRALMV